jgi:hypothetical protein
MQRQHHRLFEPIFFQAFPGAGFHGHANQLAQTLQIRCHNRGVDTVRMAFL